MLCVSRDGIGFGCYTREPGTQDLQSESVPRIHSSHDELRIPERWMTGKLRFYAAYLILTGIGH